MPSSTAEVFKEKCMVRLKYHEIHDIQKYSDCFEREKKNVAVGDSETWRANSFGGKPTIILRAFFSFHVALIKQYFNVKKPHRPLEV